MARFPVNVKLEILVFVEKAASCFVDQEMVGIFLGNQIGVITMGDGSPDLYHLS